MYFLNCLFVQINIQMNIKQTNLNITFFLNLNVYNVRVAVRAGRRARRRRRQGGVRQRVHGHHGRRLLPLAALLRARRAARQA